MSLAKLLVSEIYIIFSYSLWPTCLTLLLTLVHMNYSFVISLIKTFVFLRIVHKEDRRTGALHFKFITIKLISAMIVYYVTDYAATILEDQYLPPGLFAGGRSNTDFAESPSKIKITKTKAKTLISSTKSNDILSKGKVLLLRALLEYLLICETVAYYRMTFLLIIFIVYAVVHILIWYFVPASGHKENGYHSGEDE